MKTPRTGKLKTRARILLDGHYGFFARITFILLGSEFLLSSVIDAAIPSQTGLNGILYFACSALANMLYYILLAGACKVYLNHMRGLPCSIRDLTFSFHNQPEQIAIYSVIQYLIALIFSKTLTWTIDGILSADPAFSFLIYLLGLLLAAVFTLWISLTLAPVLYLYCDSPEKTAVELMQESKSLMKTNRIRLLKLQLSFIGLEFLNLLSLGIAALFIQPYLELSQNLFFENLTADNSASETFEESEPINTASESAFADSETSDC